MRINKIIVAMMAIAMLCNLFTSCGEDEDEPTEIVSEIYKKYPEDPLTGRKETYSAETIEGCRIYYTLLTNKECEITKQLSWDKVAYDTITGRVTIPSVLFDSELNRKIKVVAVGKDAFYAFSKMTEVVLSNSVTVLKDDAFEECNALTKLEMPNVKEIGNYAFYGCWSLSEITLPDNIKKIGEGVFCQCVRLKSVIYRGKTYHQASTLKEALEENGVEVHPNAFKESPL